MNEALRLQKIRDLIHALSGAEWMLAADGKGMFVEAKGSGGELVPILRFHRGATPEEIEFVAAGPGNVRFLLGLVDRAIRAHRKAQEGPAQGEPRSGETTRERKARDFAAEAAMKCQEPAFKAFLEERHGLERPLTDDRTAQRLRSLLGVTSRRELNEGGEAAERWKRLRGDFEQWRKAG